MTDLKKQLVMALLTDWLIRFRRGEKVISLKQWFEMLGL